MPPLVNARAVQLKQHVIRRAGLEAIKIGWEVQLCNNWERFWVRVDSIDVDLRLNNLSSMTDPVNLKMTGTVLAGEDCEEEPMEVTFTGHNVFETRRKSR